ncbi:biotin synthase BioB [Bacteroidia bacterium]|nr:biotin synthase BioB [Bacteroidia bacterium]
MSEIRYDWTVADAKEIYQMPLLDLVYKAATVHREYHDPSKVQISSLLSIKTGGCKEDCSYCPQAARYHTDVDVHKTMDVEDVLVKAEAAKKSGANRMCLGAAWREVRDNSDFDKVLNMVKGINELDMEVCCTLGMLTQDQANKLADAGVYAYNHNIDTSEDYYGEVISTRTYDDRLNTLKSVRKAKMTICSGGIIGMGESIEDRLKMLITLSDINPHPESVPINTLVPVKGTPLADQGAIPFEDLLRMIATARIMMPKSMVRLSAGRLERSTFEQGFCFMAGANSIFAGDKLLTTPNPEFNQDLKMFDFFGLTAMDSIHERRKKEEVEPVKS